MSIRIPHRFCAASIKKTAKGRAIVFSRTVAIFISLTLWVSATAPLAGAQAARPGSRSTSQKAARKTPAKSKSSSLPASAKAAKAPASAAADPSQKELARLARALHDDPNSATYAALADFAARNSKAESGARAALALGYHDLAQGNASSALQWLLKADGDKLLREYVQYWRAQALLAAGQKEEGVELLDNFRRTFPDSVMADQALTGLAQNALAIGKPEQALAALEAYPGTASRPGLLFMRAQAREKLGSDKRDLLLSAAADYLDIYYRFPLNDEARAAGQRISLLQPALGEAFPGTPMQTQIVRAETFYAAKRWRDARAEYSGLLPKLSGNDRELAELRVAQCDVQSGGRAEILTTLSLTSPALDAERIYTLSQAHRSQKLEAQMLDEINDLAARFPQSPFVEDGLFAAGNYYWVNLDRDRAAEFYRRTVAAAPDGKNAPSAAWRVAWAAYLNRAPEAADLLEAYIRRFPRSSYIQDALYWLGRVYERSGKLPAARGFYAAGATRFPLTYFGAKAAARLAPPPDGIGRTPAAPVEPLAAIAPPPPLPPMDQPLSSKGSEREMRAHALSDIAFDASAELEYRAAFASEHAPRLLVATATAAIAAGHYGIALVTMRQAFPQLESRRISDIPLDAWRTAFPLPYELSVRTAGINSQVDPMLLAGLIRQESAFEANALSHSGAVGLMQVMPKTATKLARQLKLRYTRSRLGDPGYNLQLGSHYLAGLIQLLGTPEAALAAYNAGEDRVAQWTAGQNYQETAEFVESIPFTETREYVQIVIRNADVYRQLYGPNAADAAVYAAPRSEVTR